MYHSIILLLFTLFTSLWCRSGVRFRTLSTFLESRFINLTPRYSYSTLYSTKEVQIPVTNTPNGFIAGRLWEGKSDSGPKYAPVICLHGWADSLVSYDPLLSKIIQGRNMTGLSFDLTGHGRSYHTPGPYSDLHLETILSVLTIIRHYKWEKVNLLGHSFGGLVGLSFAASFPDLVQSFVGFDILMPLVKFSEMSGQASTSALIRYNTEILRKLREKLGSGKSAPEYSRDEMIERMFRGRIPQGGLTREGCDMLIDRGSVRLPNGKLKFSSDPRNEVFFLFGLQSLLHGMPGVVKAVECPVLNMTTDPSTGWDKVPFITDLVETLKGTVSSYQNSVINGTHHVHMLNSERVAPLVTTFLDSTNS